MSRCVIISAAPITNYEKVKSFFRSDDFCVFCDGGLSHCGKLDVAPDLIVGDFDSFDKTMFSDSLLQYLPVETISLPREKDDTDTFSALKECLKRGFSEFVLIGVLGKRFDHSLCNISALIYIHNRGAKGRIIDDYSEMELICNGDVAEITDNYSYFSVMNITGDADGVTIKNAKYPLENAQLKAEYSFGISNEVLPGKVASVSVEKGMLLLVKIW